MRRFLAVPVAAPGLPGRVLPPVACLAAALPRVADRDAVLAAAQALDGVDPGETEHGIAHPTPQA